MILKISSFHVLFSVLLLIGSEIAQFPAVGDAEQIGPKVCSEQMGL